MTIVNKSGWSFRITIRATDGSLCKAANRISCKMKTVFARIRALIHKIE